MLLRHFKGSGPSWTRHSFLCAKREPGNVCQCPSCVVPRLPSGLDHRSENIEGGARLERGRQDATELGPGHLGLSSQSPGSAPGASCKGNVQSKHISALSKWNVRDLLQRDATCLPDERVWIVRVRFTLE